MRRLGIVRPDAFEFHGLHRVRDFRVLLEQSRNRPPLFDHHLIQFFVLAFQVREMGLDLFQLRFTHTLIEARKTLNFTLQRFGIRTESQIHLEFR
jgi:hypothetical protein